MAKTTKKAAAKPSAKKKATPKAQKDRTPSKPPKPPREEKAATGKPAPKSAVTMDPKLREVFLADKAAYAKAKEKLNIAQRGMQAIGKTIKADGFTMRQIKIAIELDSPEGEAEVRMRMASDLIAARYVGAAIGNHLDVFLNDVDLRPAVDRAYDQGAKDSMENKRCDPSMYHTTTPQHAAYLKGFQDDTERRVKEGIKAPAEKNLITKDEKAAQEKAAKDAEEAKQRANSPVPSVPKENSRVDELAARRAAKDQANAIFEKPAGNA